MTREATETLVEVREGESVFIGDVEVKLLYVRSTNLAKIGIGGKRWVPVRRGEAVLSSVPEHETGGEAGGA